MGLIDGLHNVPERFKRCCSSLAPPPTNNNNNNTSRKTTYRTKKIFTADYIYYVQDDEMGLQFIRLCYSGE